MKQLNHNVALRVKLAQDLDTARETIQHLQVSYISLSPLYTVYWWSMCSIVCIE